MHQRDFLTNYDNRAAWISCRFFMSLFCLCIGLVGQAKLVAVLALIASGLIVDTARWKLAPEFRRSSAERLFYFQNTIWVGRNPFSGIANKIYWIWWIYIFLLVLIQINIGSTVTAVASVIGITRQVYPWIDDIQMTKAAYLTPERSAICAQVFSMTWWFMLLAVVSEVSGNAFR